VTDPVVLKQLAALQQKVMAISEKTKIEKVKK